MNEGPCTRAPLLSLLPTRFYSHPHPAAGSSLAHCCCGTATSARTRPAACASAQIASGTWGTGWSLIQRLQKSRKEGRVLRVLVLPKCSMYKHTAADSAAAATLIATSSADFMPSTTWGDIRLSPQ